MEENYIEIPLIGQKKKTYKNGDVYEGSFVNGKREGKGTYIFKNGDKYEGDFKGGMKDGKGKYTYNNGNIYEGDWKEDEKCGKGTYYFLSHSDVEELRYKDIKQVCNIYVGDFKEGKFEEEKKNYNYKNIKEDFISTTKNIYDTNKNINSILIHSYSVDNYSDILYKNLPNLILKY